MPKRRKKHDGPTPSNRAELLPRLRPNGLRPGDTLDEIDDLFTPRHNGYKCMECGKAYLVVDLDYGVTPMFMSCFRTEGCPGQAVSMGYPQGTPPPDLPLLVEWIKPTQAMIERKGIKHPGLIEFYNRGGLMRRATPDAPQWVKDLM